METVNLHNLDYTKRLLKAEQNLVWAIEIKSM